MSFNNITWSNYGDMSDWDIVVILPRDRAVAVPRHNHCIRITRTGFVSLIMGILPIPISWHRIYTINMIDMSIPIRIVNYYWIYLPNNWHNKQDTCILPKLTRRWSPATTVTVIKHKRCRMLFLPPWHKSWRNVTVDTPVCISSMATVWSDSVIPTGYDHSYLVVARPNVPRPPPRPRQRYHWPALHSYWIAVAIVAWRPLSMYWMKRGYPWHPNKWNMSHINLIIVFVVNPSRWIHWDLN